MIRRIGRPANPAERGYQLVVENSAVLDHVARNLYGAIHNVSGCALDSDWDALKPTERDAWRNEALVRLKAHAESYQPPPRPGAPCPPGSELPVASRTVVRPKRLRLA